MPTHPLFCSSHSISIQFDKYCAPILNLGGLSIDIVKTDSEGHARRYVEELDVLPQAILVAGGDGTLSEIVTGKWTITNQSTATEFDSLIPQNVLNLALGLFRRSTQNNEAHPVIGVLPVGRENTFAESLFNFTNSSELERARGLADASLSIVRGNVVAKDAMKIEVIDEQSNVCGKPVYAFSNFEWSAYIDAFNARDRYWYLGSLRDYATFIFNAFSDSISWNCTATITYTDPCAGCSNCYVPPKKYEPKPGNRRWWSGFIPSFRLGSSQSSPKAPDYSKIRNANCAAVTSIECDSAGLIVSTSNIEPNQADNPHLTLKIVKGESGFGFIGDSWNRLNKRQIISGQENSIRTIEILPKLKSNDDKPEQERFFYIDHESYEIKPIRITLLPRIVNFYSS